MADQTSACQEYFPRVVEGLELKTHLVKPISSLVNRACNNVHPASYGLLIGALFFATPVHASDANDTDGDGIPDSAEGYSAGLISGFETPVIASGYVYVDQGQVPSWNTTSAASHIEIWQSGHGSVPSYEGDQHAEINGTDLSALFVDVDTVPGTTLLWRVAHRGRTGVDTTTVSAGAPGGSMSLIETMVTDNTGWKVYEGSYVVPEGQVSTRLTFAAQDGETYGNFLDGLVVTTQSRDSDGDGIEDYRDDDSDNDGIADATEGSVDSDDDGMADYLDTDSDDDGLPDSLEGSADTDGDGLSDYIDSDSDADGITDSVESNAPETRDTDGDGLPDHRDTDSDEDGIADSVEGADNGSLDTDTDSLPNYLDLDSDADGIADSIEGNVDTDRDGQADYIDTDSDGDGLPDAQEGDNDANGNGVPDFQEQTDAPPADTDGDGLSDNIEGDNDTDGDGLADFEDTDSDNDGIPDQTEALIDGQGPVDTDLDGVFDFRDLDSDNDGIPDAIELTSDFDGDGIANFLDLDSDNDGIADLTEANRDRPVVRLFDANQDGVIDRSTYLFGANGLADTVETDVDSGEINYALANGDGDARADYLDRDSDNDGIFDTLEAGQLDADLNGSVDTPLSTWAMPVDSDADGVADFRDLDSDNDGLSDLLETIGVDADGNGTIDEFSDADGDGVDDKFEPAAPLDTDDDGVNNQLDLDSDQDGLTDLVENGGQDVDQDGRLDEFVDDNSDGMEDSLFESSLMALDDDADGVPNYLDLDSDNDAVFDLVQSGGTDADNNGVIDAFVDPDGDGLNGGEAPEPTLLRTGLSGGIGCALAPAKSPFDPLFLIMLAFAGIGLCYRKIRNV